VSRRFFEPSPDPGRFGATVMLSLTLHVAGFTLAIALPRLMPRGAAGPPVYVVDLVSPPEGGSPGGGSEAPSPAPAPARPKILPPPRPEKAIKLPAKEAKKKPEPKKPEPRKPETKSKPVQAATPSPHAAAASEATPAPETASGKATGGTGTASGGAGAAAGTGKPGGPGGTGTGSGDISNFYFTLLRHKIEAAWQKPIYPPTETVRRILTATVRLSLTSSGRVTGLDLVTPSGYEALDRSVLRAVQDGQPFPPFPYQLGAETLTVQFAFDLTPD
jgi:TonB family protein